MPAVCEQTCNWKFQMERNAGQPAGHFLDGLQSGERHLRHCLRTYEARRDLLCALLDAFALGPWFGGRPRRWLAGEFFVLQ